MPTRTRSRMLSPTTEMASEEKEERQPRGVASSRGRRMTDSLWFQQNLKALSVHFNPVAFPPPRKRLEIEAHESLLTRLGLWDFVNLDFDEAIREDMIKELVLSYSHKNNPRLRMCQVNGLRIFVNRSALGKALRLPLKRNTKGGAFSVSEEEGSFLEQLIWSFLVLRDEGDASLMSDSFMLGFSEVLKEKRFGSADWAGLVFFMVEGELLRGKNLTNCYYASHMQLLLKHQKPEWFGGVPLESGQAQSILTKCGKRKREFLDDVDDEGKGLRKLDLGGRELFLDEDGDEGKRLVIEGGSLDAMCQREDLLENGEMLLPDLQVNANAHIHPSECDITDISVTQPGYSESHTYYPAESGIKTAEAKGVDMNDCEIFEGMESRQVTYCHAGSAHVEGRKNEGGMNFGSGASGEAHHENQNDMIGEPVAHIDGVNSSLDTHKIDEHWIQQKKLEIIDEHQAQKDGANEAICETSTGIALEVHCMKEDDPMLDETSNENALKVHCTKGALHVVPDEPSESHIVDLLIVPSLTEEVNTAQDCCQQELEFKNEAEKNREAEFSGDEIEVYTGKEVDSVASVGWLMADEGVKKVGSSGGLDSQEKKNQLKKVNIIENQHQFEIGCINATKMNGDSIDEVVGDGMNHQEADLNCMADNAGMRVESWSSVDLLVTREDHRGVLKKDSSTDGLDYQDIDNQQQKVDMIENQLYKPDLEFNSAFEMNGADFSFDGMDFQEIGLNCVPDNTARASFNLFMTGPCLEHIGNEFSLEMPENDDAMGPLVSQACEGRISDSLGKQNLHKVQPVPIDVSSASSDDEECQNKVKHLERGEGSGMNEMAGRTHVSLGQFPSQTANFGMNAQYGHGGDNYSIGIGTSNEHVERLRDLAHRAETVNVSLASLTDSVKAIMEESHNTNMMLQKKADEQNQLTKKYKLMLQKVRRENQQCKLTLQMEREQKQRGDNRYERELNLMNSVLQGHRKTIKEINTSFAKYIELPEGYMAHPDGGGRLVLVSEWEQEQKNKSLLAIKDAMENFEEQWKSNIKEQSGVLGVYSERIENIKDAVKTMKP